MKEEKKTTKASRRSWPKQLELTESPNYGLSLATETQKTKKFCAMTQGGVDVV